MRKIFKFLFRMPASLKFEELLFHAVAWGLILSMALAVAVVATGNTFGQRCATVFEPGTAEFTNCVERLNQGGDV